MHHHHFSAGDVLDRRRAILGTAALATAAALIGPGVAEARDRDQDRDEDRDQNLGREQDDSRPLPPPKPIHGTFPGTPFHVFAPGPTTITLPFSGLPLMGLDVEPNVMTDYRGFTALAYPVGTARGSDGKQYNLEGDMRIFQGTYVSSTGVRQEGTFGFV